jgi:hypothetical protein
MVEEYYETDKSDSGRRKHNIEDDDWYQDRDDYQEEAESKPEAVASKAAKAEPVMQHVVKQEAAPVPKDDVGEMEHQLMVPRLIKPGYVSSNVSKRDLRKAIVWSEILAPPKALRDE